MLVFVLFASYKKRNRNSGKRFLYYLRLVSCTMILRGALYVSTCAAEPLLASDKTRVALLELEPQTQKSEVTAWSLVEHDLIRAQLKLTGSLDVVPDAVIRNALTELGRNSGNISEMAPKLGEALNARFLIWDHFQRDSNLVRMEMNMFNVTNRQLSTTVMESSDYYDLRDRVSDAILRDLNMSPLRLYPPVIKNRWTPSLSALESYGQAEMLSLDVNSLANAENLCSNAISADPHFVEVYNLLSEIFALENKYTQAQAAATQALSLNPDDVPARKMLGVCLWVNGKADAATQNLTAVAEREDDDPDLLMRLAYIYVLNGRPAEAAKTYCKALALDPYSPDNAFAHAELASIYERQDRFRLAVEQLTEASRCCSSTNIWTEQVLANDYAQLGLMGPAVEHCASYLTLARQQAVNRSQIQVAEALLSDWKLREKVMYITNAAPEYYTPDALELALKRRLNSNDLNSVVNPLGSTKDMKQMAEDLTEGATNDRERARFLFDAIMQYGDNDPLLPGYSLTAQEAFTLWKKGERLHCQQTSYLFVALARVVGLKAYVVSVKVTVDGLRVLHECAAVYFGNTGLLVDPMYRWFGVPHKCFTVLDDVQAIGVYLCALPDITQKRVASKLAPSIALVQYNLCSSLMESNRWAEAAELLPTIARLDSGGAISDSAQALYALHCGEIENALKLLREATGIDANNATLYIQLGDVYSVKGDLSEARNAFKKSLNFPHTKEQGEAIAGAIEEIGRRLPETQK